MQTTRVSRLHYNHGNTSSFIQIQHTDTIRYNIITSVPIYTLVHYSGESNNYIITVYEGVSGDGIGNRIRRLQRNISSSELFEPIDFRLI